MSYAMVWLNGHLVGGWPYGYNSWQLDLTPYIEPREENQLAIRHEVEIKNPRLWGNPHHDLGALGAAFNLRAAERQLEVLRIVIRM